MPLYDVQYAPDVDVLRVVLYFTSITFTVFLVCTEYQT